MSGADSLTSLPDGWRRVPLKTVCDFAVSNVDKLSFDDELPVRLCNYTDVYRNERVSPDMDLMAATATRQEIERFHLEVGDVVITKDSESWNDIAVSAYVEGTAHDFICGYHLAFIRPRRDVLDGRFLFRCMQSRPIALQLELAATGVTRFGLPKDAIGLAVLPLPPLPIQFRIANYLDRETARIDGLIAEKERMLVLLEEKRAALISRVVTRGLDPKALLKPSGQGWLGEIPAHWEMSRLKYLGETVLGLTFNPDDLVNEGEGVLVLRASNVKNRKIVLEDNIFVQTDIPQKLRTKPLDILICSRSGSRALIGKNALITNETSNLTFGAFMTLYRSSLNRFLFWVFNSTLFEFQAGAFGTSTINQLTTETLANMEVPTPPLEERDAIAEFLEQTSIRFDNAMSAVSQSIDLAKERRAALISAGVTGQIPLEEMTG